MPGQRTVMVEAKIDGRDQVALTLMLDAEGKIISSKLTGVGCLELLRRLKDLRSRLSGALSNVALPSGRHHADLLLKEILLKARGEWTFPLTEEELCHCRVVSTAKVDAAVVGGAFSAAAVSRATNAGTSCGSCRSDIEKIIKFRVGG